MYGHFWASKRKFLQYRKKLLGNYTPLAKITAKSKNEPTILQSNICRFVHILEPFPSSQVERN